MSFVAVAIGGAVSIGTSIITGNKSAGAIKESAATTDATNRYIFDTTRADYAPAREIGAGALSKLADMYGVPRSVGTAASTPTAASSYVPDGYFDGAQWVGGTGTTAAEPAQTMTAGYDGFQASPGYQFRLSEATKAIERSAAARGRLRSGATMDALQRRVQGVAADEYDTYANRLAALAGVGQTANGATASAGANYANQQSQTNMAAGNARASAYQNTGNAINQGVGNLASAYLYNKGYGGGSTSANPYSMAGGLSG